MVKITFFEVTWLAPTQNFQNLEKGFYCRDLKADEAGGIPEELSTNTSGLHPNKCSKGLSMPALNQLFTCCSLGNRLGFHMENQL